MTSSHITFIIGGSLGLSDTVKSKSALRLSFGKMTLQEYIALYTIESERENSPNNNGRT